MNGQAAMTQTEVKSDSPPVSTGALSGRWIQSARFDTWFFLLSPIFGFSIIIANVVLSPRGAILFGLAAFYFVGMPHYLSTYTFYLGDDNLAQYWMRRMAFFGGPLVILAAVIFLRRMSLGPVLASTVFVWNVYHVSMQSSGILNIYRKLNDGPMSEKRLASFTILAVNYTMAFWFIERYQPLTLLLGKVHSTLPAILGKLCLLIAIVPVFLLTQRILRRSKRISAQELSFLLVSIALFHPFLWVRDTRIATFAMLMGHFIQYLAIVWLLNRRKYAYADGSRRQQFLGRLSRQGAALIAAFLVSGASFWAVQWLSRTVGFQAIFDTVLLAIPPIHFYQDGLVWAFRRAYVRESIGSYLLGGPVPVRG
jgi:hypothetical protein